MRIRGTQVPLFPLGRLSVEQIQIKLDRLEILWYNLIVIRKEIDTMKQEPNFAFIDLVLSGVMIVGAIIVWLVFRR